MNPYSPPLSSATQAISFASGCLRAGAFAAVPALVGLLSLPALRANEAAEEARADQGAETAAADKPVSYYEQVRPAFQAKCQGCHQPAKARGGYVMTEVAALLAGGDGTGRTTKIPFASSSKNSRLLSAAASSASSPRKTAR